MKSVHSWLEEYGESHQHPVNKRIHWICVPLIMFSLIGLLWAIPQDYFPGHWINWGSLLVLLALIYYLILSPKIFIGMFLISLGLILGNSWVAESSPLIQWRFSLSIFVLAWIGQFIGHKIEGKKPSFFKDVQFLLIGPAWLLSFIYKKLGIRF